ncbi:hypothetical protein [Afipia sp. Root123D2]|uniref:hypothetical protein n=1 Tax=Afipia sp. Root123D2 TaxID=1736436 RepID=UPI001FCDF694|nr:hypothetical protein [Afipia sp. Root123D2]
MHLHLTDMLKKLLGFRAWPDAAIGPVKKPLLEDEFDLCDAPGDRRVVDLENFCGGINAALSRDFEDDPQVVPGQPFQLRHLNSSSPDMRNIRNLQRILLQADRARELSRAGALINANGLCGRSQASTGGCINA